MFYFSKAFTFFLSVPRQNNNVLKILLKSLNSSILFIQLKDQYFNSEIILYIKHLEPFSSFGNNHSFIMVLCCFSYVGVP